MPPGQHSYQERSNLEHYTYIHNIFNLRDTEVVKCIILVLLKRVYVLSHRNKKSLKIPKGGNQNPYIEEEQTTQLKL
jgi:hypothetical protein